ncbi:hypothetical protein GCM10009795_061320 [Nocardioides hankookensis]|uniref:Uncharacterized protein n=1 Tax=Nocardioides hankookensis TaxID=443157 RepID=A0ABW1LN67_9ACTN
MKHLKRNAALVAATAVIAAVGIGGVMTATADSPRGSGHSQTEKSDGDGEIDDDGTEVGEVDGAEEAETNDDATDTGPDANPNEPGHQDASDAGDGDGETAD